MTAPVQYVFIDDSQLIFSDENRPVDLTLQLVKEFFPHAELCVHDNEFIGCVGAYSDLRRMEEYV